MNDSIELDPATHALVRGFFEDYRIRSIGISIGADIRNDVICGDQLFQGCGQRRGGLRRLFQIAR